MLFHILVRHAFGTHLQTAHKHMKWYNNIMYCMQDPSDSLMVRAQKLYDHLSEEVCPGHVILDDRTHLSMGARIRDSQQLNYPCTVIIGHKVTPLLSLSLPSSHLCMYKDCYTNFIPIDSSFHVCTECVHRVDVHIQCAMIVCVLQTAVEEYEVTVQREEGVDTQSLTLNQVTQIVQDLHTLSNTFRL